MLWIRQRLSESQAALAGCAAPARLVLPFELRSRSRFRAQLESGEEVGVVLERGQVLRAGTLLRAADGRMVQVAAALESVSTACDPGGGHALLRAAYHLGNRHVALQLGQDWLRYRHDHVLDVMVQGFGLSLQVELAPFEPESGAYAGHHGSGSEA